MELRSVGDLVRAAVALGAPSVGPLSDEEARIIRSAAGAVPPEASRDLRERINAGQDPLGDAYCRMRSAEQRRPFGQTYTPPRIVDAMVDWASDQGDPGRVIDPGSGSGRYAAAAARRFPHAAIVATDIDPIATLMTRAGLAALGAGGRASVRLGDYRRLALPPAPAPTLFIGNPPYVRHHLIGSEWKKWLADTARRHGVRSSTLAGLHVHFFLATAELLSDGDFGTFVTSAEWLDVNYGAMVRQLLLTRLHGLSIHVLEPDLSPFADAATTAAITCFRASRGSRPATGIRLRRVGSVAELGRLNQGRLVAHRRLAEASRWSVLTRTAARVPEGRIELGELCRVHRGTVTGANHIWVTRREDAELPDSVLFPSVTKARELFDAGERIENVPALRCVIDLPVDLDALAEDDRRAVLRFLAVARARGADRGYVATNRRAWWSVGLRRAAPILATYMARRPPAFVRNDLDVRHINIAHGLYPREELPPTVLDRLAAHLRSAVTLAQGRTYAGGLTKFEPGEMERLRVPSLGLLQAAEAAG